MPSLVHKIILLTNLTKNSLFIDLGRCQLNLQLAEIANGITTFRHRLETLAEPTAERSECWRASRSDVACGGVGMGEVELERGDMLVSCRANKLIKATDVVLINNYKFDPLYKGQKAIKFQKWRWGQRASTSPVYLASPLGICRDTVSLRLSETCRGFPGSDTSIMAMLWLGASALPNLADPSTQ
ncbi:hypothetical protein B0H14DRAFT_3707149 [Mycena olivaceomarginata]|nr:hypothetical protein B0H14DRAFT_3707149 [Mycena olivaceomarginata]